MGQECHQTNSSWFALEEGLVVGCSLAQQALSWKRSKPRNLTWQQCLQPQAGGLQ